MKIKTIVLTSIILFSMVLIHVPDALAQTATISADPPSFTASQINQEFTVAVKVSNVENLIFWGIFVDWDEEYIELAGDPEEGDFLSSQVSSTFFVFDKDRETPTQPGDHQDLLNRMLDVANTVIPLSDPGASGSGTLATLHFKVLKPVTQTQITLFHFLLVDEAAGPTLDQYHYITPASETVTVTVSLPPPPGPPIVDAGKDQTVVQGTSAVLNGTKTIVTGENPTYTWTFTDGTQQTLNGTIVNYTFDNPGNYTITLTVTDSLGTGTDTTIVTVTPTENTDPTPTDIPGTTATPSPTPTSNAQQPSLGISFPPTVAMILVGITVFILMGSVFWLRKNG